MSDLQEINEQPFMISMKMANRQTENFDSFSALLLEQQIEFKEYIYERCRSDKQIHKDFFFLKIVESELKNIRLQDGDMVRKINPDFYIFWTKLLIDTYGFISSCIDVFNFRAKCPEYLISEPVQIIAEYKWTLARIDLSEVLVGIFLSGAVLQKTAYLPILHNLQILSVVISVYPTRILKLILKQSSNENVAEQNS
jgi:hypothetical protein